MESTENKENKKQSRPVIWIVLLVVSVLANLYLWNRNRETVVVYDTKIDSLITVRVEIEKELASTAYELNSFKGLAANLDSLVNEANDKIKIQEEKIKTLLKKESNQSSLNKKLQAELAELRKLKESYLDQIDILITENKQLKAENAQLYTSVTALTEEKGQLEQKVSTASMLRTEYVKVNTMKRKGNDKYVSTSLAKKTNKIEVCFSLLDNKLTNAGEKMVYLRIIAPDGMPLGDKVKGSKSFLRNDTQEELMFTISKKIDYKNEKQELCLDYEEQERIMTAGTYIVEVYVDGNLSTTTNFILR
jgi:hypothetical protein